MDMAGLPADWAGGLEMAGLPATWVGAHVVHQLRRIAVPVVNRNAHAELKAHIQRVVALIPRRGTRGVDSASTPISAAGDGRPPAR